LKAWLQRTVVIFLVLRGGLKLVIAGLTAGIFGATAISQLLSGFLFGISAADPLTFGAVSIFVVVTGAIASYFPARSAVSTDPASVLRAG
jgi:putative ABC transport system permease protein